MQSVPTVVAVVAGQPVDGFNGALPEPDVRKWISRLLDALRDRMPGIREAENGRAAGPSPRRSPTTRGSWPPRRPSRRATGPPPRRPTPPSSRPSPANEQAAAALGQVRFLARAEQADPARSRGPTPRPTTSTPSSPRPTPRWPPTPWRPRSTRLVATVGRTAGSDRDKAREHLVGLFELFPTDDPRVSAARRSLARALF